MKHSLLLASLAAALALAGCATNPSLDHRVVCSLDGKATFLTTYGPVALTNPVPDADVICAKVQTAQVITVSPAALAASSAK